MKTNGRYVGVATMVAGGILFMALCAGMLPSPPIYGASSIPSDVFANARGGAVCPGDHIHSGQDACTPPNPEGVGACQCNWYEGSGYRCNGGAQFFGGCEGPPAECVDDDTLVTNTVKTFSNTCAIKKQYKYACLGDGVCDDEEGPDPGMCEYQVGGPYSCTGFWSSAAGCAG
jgi:hypothetical protein